MYFPFVYFCGLAFRRSFSSAVWKGCQKADSVSFEISVNYFRQPKLEQQLEKEMNKCSLKPLQRTLNINEYDTLLNVNWKGSCVHFILFFL